jgi:hypothetical protein
VCVYIFLAGKHQGVVDAKIGAEEEAPLDLYIVRVTVNLAFSDQNVERHASIKQIHKLRCRIFTGSQNVCSQLASSWHFKSKWEARTRDRVDMRTAYQPTAEDANMRRDV